MTVKNHVLFFIYICTLFSLFCWRIMSFLYAGYLHVFSSFSGTQSLAVVPGINFEPYGRRTFPFAGPSLWNALPLGLTTQQDPDRFRGTWKRIFLKLLFQSNCYNNYFIFAGERNRELQWRTSQTRIKALSPQVDWWRPQRPSPWPQTQT